MSLTDTLGDNVPDDMGTQRLAAVAGASAGSVHLGLVHVLDTNLVADLIGTGNNTLVFGAFGVAGAVLAADTAGVLDLDQED